MMISDEVKILINNETAFIADEKSIYEEAVKKYDELIKKGFIKRRGHCLQSIADYTDPIFSKSNVFEK